MNALTPPAAGSTGLKRPPRSLQPEGSPRRLTIYFQDDAVRQRSQDAVQQLLTRASSPDASSNSALLAKKALKYRNVYDRMSGVDVTSPQFDASKFMGVDWCHTPSLTAFCATRAVSDRAVA